MKKPKLLKIIISWLIIPTGYLYCCILSVVLVFFIFSSFVNYNLSFLLIYLIVNGIIIFLICYFGLRRKKKTIKQLAIIGLIVVEVLMASDICLKIVNRLTNNRTIYAQILIKNRYKEKTYNTKLKKNKSDEFINDMDLFASDTDETYIVINETNASSDLTNDFFDNIESDYDVCSDFVIKNNKIEINVETVKKLLLFDSRLLLTSLMLLFNSVILSFIGINIFRQINKSD